MTTLNKLVDAAVNDAVQSISGTGYPYFDFEDSLIVARRIHELGGGSCDLDQLAAWLDYKSTSSGTFASRLASARYFGLIGPTQNGRIALTDRARAILAPVMPDDAVNGRAEAFLGVPLYKKVFERFRGSTIPPDVGLKNHFEQEYKILAARSMNAVRVFKLSAEQTGFLATAKDRLIRPAPGAPDPAVTASATLTSTPQRQEMPEPRRGGGGGGDSSGIDPSLLGLLRRLPQPGGEWTAKDQEAFLAAFQSVIKFLYPAKGEADGA